MSIKLMMEIERAHSRIDALEGIVVTRRNEYDQLLEKFTKLEGELRAMKARMGKRETVEI